ncbi:hypothetical protein RRG08_023426 [Elysia crispata]|uniref:Uncharacterized protein n=1 Tax=Elysia crispata TaxID=231223 RepID=A0AAE0YEV6_9GAST|nr:hypothetical protein RRG08_023426 [Elysia crispata]
MYVSSALTRLKSQQYKYYFGLRLTSVGFTHINSALLIPTDHCRRINLEQSKKGGDRVVGEGEEGEEPEMKDKNYEIEISSKLCWTSGVKSLP